MCYSAIVVQDTKAAGIPLQVRKKEGMYEDLFRRRLRGEKILLNKAMELPFLADPVIGPLIRDWHEEQVPLVERELFAQKKRLADAERALEKKATKKSENEKRIAAGKIEKLKRDLHRHQSWVIESETDERIFPGHYISMLTLDKEGQLVSVPVRYLLRPHDQGEAFDAKFHGCYNARLDSLDRVAWWKNLLGRRHGVIVVRKFYENVATEDYGKNFPLSEEEREKKTTVLSFQPDGKPYMYIPVLWDIWRKKGEPDLYSAALITDEPAPEIAEAGHDRTPVFLRHDAVFDWLRAKGRSVEELRPILDRRERPHYSHRVVA